MEVVLLRAGRFKLSPASWRPAWKVLRLQVVVVFRSGPGARPCHRLSTVVVVTDAGRHERLNDHRQFELRPQLNSSTTANKKGRKVMYCGSEFCHYCLLLLVQWKILYERGKCHVQQCILYSVYCKENIGLMKEALRVLNGDKQVRATKTNTVSYFCETRQDKTRQDKRHKRRASAIYIPSWIATEREISAGRGTLTSRSFISFLCLRTSQVLASGAGKG